MGPDFERAALPDGSDVEPRPAKLSTAEIAITSRLLDEVLALEGDARDVSLEPPLPSEHAQLRPVLRKMLDRATRGVNCCSTGCLR